MRHVAFLLPGLIALQVSAQNVAINASGAAPNASALLDLDAAAHPVNDKKGLLVPRLALTATNVAALYDAFNTDSDFMARLIFFR